jgi:hypothetical protein
MPASLEKVRSVMNVKPTSQGKGLTLTITVDAYDNLLLRVDGVPMTGMPIRGTEAAGWRDVTTTVMVTLEEFGRQVDARRAARENGEAA